MTEYLIGLALRDRQPIDFEIWLQLQGELKSSREFLLNNYLNENDMGSAKSSKVITGFENLRLLFTKDYGNVNNITIRTEPPEKVTEIISVCVQHKAGKLVEFHFPYEGLVQEGLQKLMPDK